MMNLEVHNSNKSNQWLIRQFEAYRFEGDAFDDKFFPRPYISIIFHFNEPALITGTNPIKLEPYFAAPIIPRAINLQFQSKMDTLAITCKATVLFRIFNLDMTPIAKGSINLPESVFNPLWIDMLNLKNSTERIKCFTDFINSVQTSFYKPDAVDVLYDKILEKGISIPLKEIMKECFASKSTLLRKFLKRTGVNPKTLARIVRLDYLWTKIRDEQSINYQELVFYGNYFDQSHFINDFVNIIGETPSYFLNRNLKTVKILSGMPIQEP